MRYSGVGPPQELAYGLLAAIALGGAPLMRIFGFPRPALTPHLVAGLTKVIMSG